MERRFEGVCNVIRTQSERFGTRAPVFYAAYLECLNGLVANGLRKAEEVEISLRYDPLGGDDDMESFIIAPDGSQR